MTKSMLLFITLLTCCTVALAFGPLVEATKGEVWPKPYSQERSDNYFTINPSSFSINFSDDIECFDILDNARFRYLSIIQNSFNLQKNTKKAQNVKNIDNLLGTLDSLAINVNCSGNQKPILGDVENYTLTITTEEQTLQAATIWGILRGLETFSQLIYVNQNTLQINETSINDKPRFVHRGLHLDTSRHFYPLEIIYMMLDAMAYNKLNVFHWHLTDDQSFPYQSKKYPELSAEGAYTSTQIYKQEDIKDVIEYARLRGIRVIAEFDIPGHTQAWGIAHPELLASCYGNNDEPNGEYGPMDPTLDTTYDFIQSFIDEIVDVFPDMYIHVGGDEVDFNCWKSNPDITSFMIKNNISTYEDLQSYFMNKVVTYLISKNVKPIVWEEAFLNGVQLQNFSAIVQVWRDWTEDALPSVTSAHKYAVYSTCWYLDHLASGGDWEKFYNCEPFNVLETDLQKGLVLGGEACMWSEIVNQFNVMSRVWPRASAVAERLWSSINVTDIENAKARIEEHTCRMNSRGIGAQPPNGPGYCV